MPSTPIGQDEGPPFALELPIYCMLPRPLELHRLPPAGTPLILESVTTAVNGDRILLLSRQVPHQPKRFFEVTLENTYDRVD